MGVSSFVVDRFIRRDCPWPGWRSFGRTRRESMLGIKRSKPIASQNRRMGLKALDLGPGW